MIKEQLTNPMTTLLRKESFFKQYCQSGITSSKGLKFHQVIFECLLCVDTMIIAIEPLRHDVSMCLCGSC